jgi:putative DNA methylase
MTQSDLFSSDSEQNTDRKPAPRSFIETQFPVSKLSKECYKERKSNYSQTLTGLGKWWGRKPLILVRATILGLLLPATDDPRKDREIFLRILTMDEEGLLSRRKKFPLKDAFERLTPSEQARYFQPNTTRLKSEHRKDADKVLDIAYGRMSYDEKLKVALRPEEIDGPSEESWKAINKHLGTSATNLAELVQELGTKRFGHTPRVGDAFCGGGSIPFEAARIGCDAYGSDLNPVAALLTWAALNIVGGGPEVAERVRKAQREVYDAVDRQVTAWGIEHMTERSTGFQPVNVPTKTSDTGRDACATLQISRRNLPHWYREGATYFVTFRLGDSVPKQVLAQWEEERQIWLKSNPEPHSAEQLAEKSKLFSERREAYLDDGHGSCVLKDNKIAQIVADAMKHFDGERYNLGSWVVMPNHVHALVTPKPANDLSSILHSWKSFTANAINKALGKKGTLWQDESYDHIVRSGAQLDHYEKYIDKNVAQASSLCLFYKRSTGFQPVDHSSITGKDACSTLGDETPFKWLPDDPTARMAVLRSTPRADAYLYCVEVRCPQTGWMVPLAPSWVIGEKTRTVAILVPDHANKRYDIDIRMDASPAEMKAAKEGTVRGGRIIHPILIEQGNEANAATVAGVREANGGIRLWENDDVVPRPGDVFQERLYCIRWVAPGGTRRYASVTDADLEREERVLALLKERFAEWQAKGYIPSRMIEPGDETTRLQRERGWTHWHHLFNPRQLLVLGSIAEKIGDYDGPDQRAGVLLGLGRCADYNSRLSRWHAHGANEKSEQVFSNQALNTLLNFGVRPWSSAAFTMDFTSRDCAGVTSIQTLDARQLSSRSDVWITDPPYADAVNYHELTEFFLAWYDKNLAATFSEWSNESRRALAVVGRDEAFKNSMVSCYRNLALHMPNEGFQVVMFTHQDASVWADLALILWASGLHVTSAWCIATETDNALKEGNYVQGTVLLVLRKQTGNDSAFLDELYPEVEAEVRAQLDAMLALDDEEDPNFADTDYQLAAYAAALRVLTKYRRFEGRDVAQELNRVRPKGEKSPVEKLIEDAVRVAADHLVPHGIETFVWKTLTPPERFYLKGLDMESHGELRSGAYQELARGFGLREYRNLFESGQANQTRLKTATEFGRRDMTSRKEGAVADFDNSLLRHVLFAVAEVTKTGETSKGRLWLRTEWPNYWGDRKTILALLAYLGRLGVTLGHWGDDAASAKLLAGAVENDHA